MVLKTMNGVTITPNKPVALDKLDRRQSRSEYASDYERYNAMLLDENDRTSYIGIDYTTHGVTHTPVALSPYSERHDGRKRMVPITMAHLDRKPGGILDVVATLGITVVVTVRGARTIVIEPTEQRWEYLRAKLKTDDETLALAILEGDWGGLEKALKSDEEE